MSLKQAIAKTSSVCTVKKKDTWIVICVKDYYQNRDSFATVLMATVPSSPYLVYPKLPTAIPSIAAKHMNSSTTNLTKHLKKLHSVLYKDFPVSLLFQQYLSIKQLS